MRIWDLPPCCLCRQHLLAEHQELHCIWNVITLGKKGYSRHPETLRWVGKLGALYIRHVLLVDEMTRRGYNHKSPLDESLAVGETTQTIFLETPERQIELLTQKGCDCDLRSDR